MKKEKNVLNELLDKHGKFLCSYSPVLKKFWLVNDDADFEGVYKLKTLDFNEVGYYFLVDSNNGEPLILTSIGDQWGNKGFNDRISRIDRKATKQNKLIHENHSAFDVVFVPPSKIKYFLDTESVWNFLKGTKKTERNTILENARLIKKVYTFKY